jgi:peptidoglycan/LPS O-acetylase OafA/YrhL
MNKKWMPITAGVLDIFYGVVEVLGGSFIVTTPQVKPIVPTGIDWRTILFSLMIAAGVLVIVGGICALMRKVWWLALVGSIFVLVIPVLYVYIWQSSDPSDSIWLFAIVCFTGVSAIVAVILTILSRRQFEGK